MIDPREFRDPFKCIGLCWPQYRLYNKQREMFHSIWNSKETLVPAGHKLGKDFNTALATVVFALTRHPVRVVTTSVDGKQLDGVLWGEMRRHIQDSVVPLTTDKGGPLLMNHQMIRKVYNGEMCGRSYIMGRVAETPEGLSGHHLEYGPDGEPLTLAVADECSGMAEECLSKMMEWAHRFVKIGNCYECQNSFKWGVKGRPGTDDRGGDIARKSGDGFLRKIIRIKAEDSPNVRYGLAEIVAGKKPSNRIIIPGVLTWEEYEYARAMWDPIKQCAGLDADFWEGGDVLMFPPAWLNAAESYYETIRNSRWYGGLALGIDPAEGGDKTAWCVGDRRGIARLVSRKTPDTDVIVGETLALMREFGIPADRVCFDRACGKPHADRMRKMGYQVRTVGFGEAVTLDLRHSKQPLTARKDLREEKYAYKNRRSQMYYELREALDPCNKVPFAIPKEYHELRHQLGVIPLTRDGEGRLTLLSKSDPNPDKPSLKKLIGHSPDEADAVVLMLHAATHKAYRSVAGAA